MNAKKNGVYYTPPKLAEYLVAPLLDDRELKILDPSYGEGALLLASERVCTKANYEHKIQLFGCDIKPINGLLKHLPDANIEKKDFFDYPIAKKFDLILMNPPYVRHHIQNENKIKRYRKIIPELDSLNNFSDLWAYFLVKAMCHLKEGGSIGAILPWSFLQADYAQKLRADLFKKFGNIKALALTEKYFENADERVVLLWLKKFGESCGSLEMGSANTIKDTIKYSSLPLSNWSSNKVLYNGNTSTEDILFRYKNEFGFSEFKNYADVKIGVVTGADKYFIVSKSKAKELGFESRHLIPILTKSKNFSELHGGADNLKQLIYLTERNYKKFKSFINQGKKNEYNLRAHSTLRDPWYKVKVGNIPDGC